MSERKSLRADDDQRQARQDRILAAVRELRRIDVPEPVLAPIIRYAVIDLWSV